jgi:hypothetical protein
VQAENRRILQFAENITGFARVTIWKRERNLGAVGNIAEAVDQVFQKHDKLIFLEDDNIVAKNFLLFMNQAMDAFALDPRCFSVSGYHFMPGQSGGPRPDIYRSPFFSAWGAGLFRDRYIRADHLCGRRASSFFLNPFNCWRANKIDRRLLPMYLAARRRGAIHGDVFYRLHCLKNNLYSAFPSVTKVINRGFDGSGQNCGVLEMPFHRFFEKEEQDKFSFTPNEEVDSYFQRENCKWFSRQWPELARHTLSLYWKYFVRAVGLRRCPSPRI